MLSGIKAVVFITSEERLVEPGTTWGYLGSFQGTIYFRCVVHEAEELSSSEIERLYYLSRGDIDYVVLMWDTQIST